MNKSDLVTTIRGDDRGQHITVAQAEAIADAILASIATALVDAGRVVLRGIGTFSTAPTDERPGKNPRTGLAITIPAGTRIKFAPAAALKRAVAPIAAAA